MVSQSGSPPIPMTVQVPPGHVMQQIVDENGTLRHVFLSTQHQQMQSGVQGVQQHHIHGHYVSHAIFIIFNVLSSAFYFFFIFCAGLGERKQLWIIPGKCNLKFINSLSLSYSKRLCWQMQQVKIHNLHATFNVMTTTMIKKASKNFIFLLLSTVFFRAHCKIKKNPLNYSFCTLWNEFKYAFECNGCKLGDFF